MTSSMVKRPGELSVAPTVTPVASAGMGGVSQTMRLQVALAP